MNGLGLVRTEYREFVKGNNGSVLVRVPKAGESAWLSFLTRVASLYGSIICNDIPAHLSFSLPQLWTRRRLRGVGQLGVCAVEIPGESMV